jgi:FkbM family methyltransferase
MILDHNLSYRKGTCDEDIIRKIFVNDEYATDWCKTSVPNKPLIIDAGAHIGIASVYFATQFRKGMVASLEPAQSNYEFLKRNVSGYTNIDPINGALAAQEGFSRVMDVGRGSWGFRTVPCQTNGVKNFTVSELFKRYKEFSPYIIKIDIEGAEEQVFSGPVDWIDKTPIIIIEPHDWLSPGGGSFTPFLRAISLFKRDFYLRGENVFSVKR